MSQKQRERRIYFKILISYLMVLAVALASMMSVYAIATGTLRLSVIENTQSLLTHSMRDVEREINAINQELIILSNQPALHEYLYARVAQRDQMLNAVTKAIDMRLEIGKDKANSSAIDDLYIYSRGLDRILGTHGWSEPLTFLEKNLGGLIDEAAFEDKLYGSQRASYLTMPDGERVMMIQSFPMGVTQQSHLAGAAIVMLNKSMFTGAFEGTSLQRDGRILITAGEGQKILELTAEGEGYHIEDGSEVTNIYDGPGLIGASAESPISGWRYSAALPESVVFEPLHHVRTVTTAVIALMALLSAALIAFYTRRDAQPILHVVKRMSSIENGASPKLSHSIYWPVTNAVDTLLDDNERLHGQVQTQKSLLQHSFFSRLFSGGFQSSGEMRLLLDTIEWHFPEDQLTVVHIRLLLPKVAADAPVIEMLDRAGAEIGHLMERCLGRDALINRQDISNFFLLYAAKDDARERIQVFYDRLTAQLDLPIHMAVGGSYPGLLEATRSAREAETAVNNCHVPDTQSVLIWPDSDDWDIFRQKLTNLIAVGDEADIRRLFEGFLDEAGRCPEITRYRMINALLNAIEETKGAQGREAEDMLAQVDRLEDRAFIEAMIEQAVSLMRTSDSQTRSNEDLIADTIMKYVRDNLSDPNMGVQMICDHFDISHYHLNKYLKLQTGVSFSALLEKMRLDKAMELLRDTDMSIEDIAAATGYQSDRSFRRAFKRVYGDLPSFARVRERVGAAEAGAGE